MVPRVGEAGLPPLILEKESSCFDFLNWRTDLPPSADTPALEAWLEGKGFLPRSRHPNLRVHRDAAGHEISWIPTTGRVQLRVHYLTPVAERSERAEALLLLLRQALAAIGA